MIDQRFMDDLAKDSVLPTEMPVEDTMLAAGPVTSDVPQTGVRLGRAGVTPQQSAKAGGLDKPLIALLDTLAGAMRGATGAAIGLPGDIRSIVDLINQEGAEAVMGKRMFPTSEEVLQSNILPQVVPAGAPNAAERQKTVDVAQAVGEFLPAPGLLDVPKVVKGATKAVQATKGMPVGMSTQMVGEGVSELGFYSAAKEAVNSIQQPKGTGEQFLKQIEKTPGVKPEEIKWTGLDDFLKSKKTVTKAEVQEYLDKNRVEVKEVSLGTEKLTKKFSVNSPENEDYYDVVNKAGEVIYTGPEREADKLLDLDTTKFSKYTLPGGKNYREILLTLPSKNPEFDPKDIGRLNDLSNKTRTPVEDVEYKALAQRYDASLRGETSPEFRSGHFDQPNILAHMRVNDRVDADGKKVLFVEEVQSDWHQAGRKKGYQTSNAVKELHDYEFNLPTRAREAIKADFLKNGFTEAKADKLSTSLVRSTDFNGMAKYLDEVEKYTEIAQKAFNKDKLVPDAPFKTTWHELALKRAIQLASEGGYDRVAFTTGKTQAERYDLSKQINELAYKKMDDELTLSLGDGPYYEVVAVDKNDMPVLKRQVTEQELPDLVGKEMAKKIINGEGKGYPSESVSSGTKVFSGLDLQVGGEGMKGFYDQILPKFLDKYAKKWDAKVGMTEIKAGEDVTEAGMVAPGIGFVGESKTTKAPMAQVQYIDITPKMKESVLTKGQPLFAVGGAGAAMQQEDNK